MLEVLKSMRSEMKSGKRIDLFVLDSLTHNYRDERWDNWKKKKDHLELCLSRLRDIAIENNAAVVITSEMADNVYQNENPRQEGDNIISGGWIVDRLTDMSLFLYRSESGRVCRIFRPFYGETEFAISDTGFCDPDDVIDDGDRTMEGDTGTDPSGAGSPVVVVLPPGVIMERETLETSDPVEETDADRQEFDNYF